MLPLKVWELCYHIYQQQLSSNGRHQVRRVLPSRPLSLALGKAAAHHPRVSTLPSLVGTLYTQR